MGTVVLLIIAYTLARVVIGAERTKRAAETCENCEGMHDNCPFCGGYGK